MPYWTVITVVVFYGFRLYHSIWRFAGLDEAKRIIWSYIVLIFLYTAGIFAMESAYAEIVLFYRVCVQYPDDYGAQIRVPSDPVRYEKYGKMTATQLRNVS